ncbi:hypothetical protein Droror1_Dr00012382 [Drosera rotundifolia]
MESLHRLVSTDPPLFLTPSPHLSVLSRSSSQHLFNSLLPHTPKSPFDKLLVDGFDAEQIWQQIEIQTKPLIESLRREVKRFETNPDEISGGFEVGREKNESLMSIDEVDDGDDESDDVGLEVSDEEGEKSESEGDDDEEEDEDDEEEEGGNGGIEDEFLRIKDMRKYLDADEAREYGTKNKDGKGEEEEEEEEDDEGDDAEEDERIAYFGGDGESEDDEWENARYEDFFTKKKKPTTKKSRRADSSEDSDGEDGEDERNVDKKKTSTKKSRRVDASEDSEEEDERKGDKKKENLSTYEKLQERIDAEVKEMEKANLEPKAWTMSGEVTAAKRPKNSALGVDIDFERNAMPPPLITEEDTLSLEELIKKRVLEGIFDDVRRSPKVPLKAPKEVLELDENKSKKGLAELYEGEYAQQTGFISAPLSQTDLLKKETDALYKRLCLKLDALSHFHFAPKPVIEEMSIPVNLPALAMEEIMPVAVSDAAMLAPEEVFAGKGVIKDESELTKSDRKQRRAKKKRKFKAEQAKKLAKKARYTDQLKGTNGKVSTDS